MSGDNRVGDLLGGHDGRDVGVGTGHDRENEGSPGGVGTSNDVELKRVAETLTEPGKKITLLVSQYRPPLEQLQH
jgi:hypothetical protein